MLIGLQKVRTPNLGDHIQILAAQRLLKGMGLTPTVFLDRDHELSESAALDAIEDRVLLPLNGWFKMPSERGPQWPPHQKLVPIFSGFHIRPHACPALLGKQSLDYLRQHEPIGCRDPFTADTLRQNGIKATITNCLSLTFPSRGHEPTGTSIIISSANKDILDIVPRNLRDDHIFINHYSETASFEHNIEKAEDLLSLYRHKARLVITTFLHCALPCIALGIPVVVFYPRRKDDFWRESDRERFSGLRSISPIYHFEDAPKANWNPEPLNIEPVKRMILDDFNTKTLMALAG